MARKLTLDADEVLGGDFNFKTPTLKNLEEKPAENLEFSGKQVKELISEMPETNKADETPSENPAANLTPPSKEQVKALISETQAIEEKPKKQRRRRLKRERKQVSVYLSPAQYQIISDLADDSNKNLSDTVGEIIDEYYEILQRRIKRNKDKGKTA